MSAFRIALANIRYPETPSESIELVEAAIVTAAEKGAEIVCFPECYVPGYRGLGRVISPPSSEFLEHAWATISYAAARSKIAVVLGTERLDESKIIATTLVFNSDGTTAGFQDKVQIDPSEDDTYAPGSGRRIFQVGALTFGIVICHEGWRYPETVRWAACNGAQLVFHPHLDDSGHGAFRPTTFGDPRNTFHEKAALCRAAENNCYFATVNCARDGATTTSAVINPDGTLLTYQPYGKEGLLIADVDLNAASRLLAMRFKPVSDLRDEFKLS